MIPTPLFEVVTPAAGVALVDLATLKSDLGITGTGEDSRLGRVILSSARRISAYIGRPIVEQIYRETWRLTDGDQVPALPLSCVPVVSVSSVTEAGVSVSGSGYQWVDTVGLQRLDAAGALSSWSAGVVVVTYKAGWIGAKAAVPGGSVALPDDIYEAALDAARAEYNARNRDPSVAVKSESVPDLYSATYDLASAADSTYGLPANVAATLDAYRRDGFAW